MRTMRSPIIQTVRDTSKKMHNGGVVYEITMCEFGLRCLSSAEPLKPAEIKRIRKGAHVSQAVFTRLLNTSVSTVQKWKIKQKRPTGNALKLLHLVQSRGLEIVV